MILAERFVAARAPNAKELAFLRLVVELEAKDGEPPHLNRVAAVLGVTRQAAHYWVKRLRLKKLAEAGAGAGHVLGANAPPIRLTHAGRQAVATSA